MVGTTEARNGLIQFTSTGLAVTSISEGSTIPNDMVPQVLSAAELNAYAAAPRFAYVSVEGTLTIKDSEKGLKKTSHYLMLMIPMLRQA